jgi:hypothetical protein
MGQAKVSFYLHLLYISRLLDIEREKRISTTGEREQAPNMKAKLENKANTSTRRSKQHLR